MSSVSRCNPPMTTKPCSKDSSCLESSMWEPWGAEVMKVQS
jgi:hypothetical protein